MDFMKLFVELRIPAGFQICGDSPARRILIVQRFTGQVDK
jgi:hypothetical protein